MILLRDGPTAGHGTLELYFLRRHHEMAFAAGMAVFPGGGIDQGDFGPIVEWIGTTPAEWSSVFGTSPEHAQALIFAAVRETFEECGVLLAGSAESVVGDVSGTHWEEDRRRLEAHETTFREVLTSHGLLLRADLLTPWAHWVTPEFEPRRYNTWFLVARLPDGQQTRDVSTESKSVAWMSVDDAVRAADARSLLMLPPQYAVCLELFAHRRVSEVFAAPRTISTILPVVAVDDEGSYLVLPEELVTLGLDVERQMYGTA